MDTDEEIFEKIKGEILELFNKGEINETILLMPKYFGNQTYSLKDLFKDDQVRILDIILQEAVKKATDLNEIVYKDNSALISFMREINLTPPKPFQYATEIVLNAEVRKAIVAKDVNVESLNKLVSDAKKLPGDFEWSSISLDANKKIVNELLKIRDSPPDTKKLEDEAKLVAALIQMPIKLELWQAQNIAFEIAQKIYNPMKEKNDEFSKSWVSAFQQLCKSIGIRLD